MNFKIIEFKLKFAGYMLNLIKCLLFWILKNHRAYNSISLKILRVWKIRKDRKRVHLQMIWYQWVICTIHFRFLFLSLKVLSVFQMNMMSTMEYDGAQDSGVIGVMSVTQRLLVKASLWSLDVVMLFPST